MRAVDTRTIHSVEAVGDGDTLTLLIELGLDSLRRARIRLTVVDAPERDDPDGWAAARRFAVAWCADHPILAVDLQLTSTGRHVETFGRLLGDVHDRGTGESLSSALLEAGHAVVWK